MKQFIIEQKITAFVNRYMVYSVTADGQKDALVQFVEQKRLAFKEEITFFSDQSKTTESFKVKAEKVMDIHGKFLVTNPAGKQLGAVRKVFKSSLIRSTWEMFSDANTPALVVKERSLGLALFRRLWVWIPFIGDLPFFMKYHFTFVVPGTDMEIASYEKTTRFRDYYLLTIHDDTQLDILGVETFIAQAVLLDALQDR